MRNYYQVLFFICFLSFPLVQAQKDSKDEKRNIKQPPRLIVLDQAQQRAATPINLLTQVYNLDQNNTFKSKSLNTDKLGDTHQSYQQSFQDIPVEFAISKVHLKKGSPYAVSGEYYPIKDINIKARLTNQQAFQSAVNHIGAQHYLWEYPEAAKELDNYKKPSGELVILPVYNDKSVADFKLAYKFDIYATKPISRGDLYIDAVSGKPLFYNATIKHIDHFGHIGEPLVTVSETPHNTEYANYTSVDMVAAGTAATRYSGTQSIETQLSGGSYRLADTGRKVYTRDAKNQAPGSSYPYINNYDEFTDNDNNWTTAEHSANKDNAALDAHWGAMETYDYFLQEHNRNSYDNNGAQIRSYVHVDNNYDNAFWNGSVMSYGDGSSNGQEGNGFFDALTSIDVAAHEIGHAVTTFTANLAYRRESGGLNEGFSDIWGAAVEHFAKGNGSDSNPSDEIWLIGDEIDRRSGSAALRSMSDPTSLGQPDTYGGQFWKNPNCGTPTQSNDYCGVHTNSGVLNYWFYLLVEGGNGTNDVGDVFNVSGIGMNKSAQIAYRTLSQYLSANSTFADARAGAIQATRDLYGQGGIEEEAVTNAWYAVNVGSAFGQIDYCSSNGNSVADEYISRVQVGDIDNTSGAGNGGYQDHTSIATDLAKSTQYSVTITPTWTGTVYSEGYAAWIDYNKDGDFADAGENIGSVAATQNTTVSFNFTVPSSASDGATRMRVSMKYNGVPTSCESFSYGEVEDYTVTIGASGADTQAPTAPLNLSASNITETTVNLSWDASTDNVGVTAYEVFQNDVSLGTVTATSTQITGLTASTAYSFKVRAKDAADNTSGFSNAENVTTATPPDTQAPSNPTALSASNVTETTLDLSWTASTDNVGVTEYDVFQGATNLGSTTATSANITGLTANTAYSFRVRAKDAAGNISGFSNTVNVTTAGGSSGGNGCTNGVSSFPYTESFEANFGAWTNNTNDDIQWSRDSAATPSNNTGPSSGSAGSFYVYVEASGNGTGYPNKQAILTSPCFDLSGETGATFNFDYHMFGASDMGNLIVEASDDNGASWTSLFSETGNKGNQWNSASLDLSAYVGGSLQVRFNRTTGSTWQADIALDNISVTTGTANQGPPTGYCASSSNNTNDEYISRVQIGSINNATGASASGYGDFTSLSTTLGANNTITITPTWTGTVYAEGYAVWVDFNRDGDFGDAGELVFSRSATTATSVSGSFGVPAGASSGATRMRVSMMYNGIPTACQNFTYGEVEDYVVNIATNTIYQGVTGLGSGLTELQSDNQISFNIYPNPVKGSILNVEFISRDKASYNVYNLLGQKVISGELTNTINVSNLPSGVYILNTTIDGRETSKRFIKE